MELALASERDVIVLVATASVFTALVVPAFVVVLVAHVALSVVEVALDATTLEVAEAVEFRSDESR